jgi:hypothetical protein
VGTIEIGSTVTSLHPDARRVAQHKDAGVAPYTSGLPSPNDIAGSKGFIDPLDAIISKIQDESTPTAWEIIHQLHSFPSPEEMAFRSSQKPKRRSPLRKARTVLRFPERETRLVVQYDGASANARIVRKRIAFFDVLAIGYRKSAAQLDRDLGSGGELRCLSQSRWLNEVITAWQSSLRCADRLGNKQPGRGFKHYTVLSIHGRVDVVAVDCRPV